MDLNEILRAAAKHGASDVHLKVGLPPVFRINGKLVPLKVPEPLKPGDLEAMTEVVFQEGQKERFERRHELDCAYGVPGLGRFRVNVFQQRGTIGIVMRLVPVGVRTFEDLHLPKVMEKIALEERGLILCTGTTGCGKSTTLAAMVQYINTHRSCHVMTIEDPIEFLLRDGKSIINQRELGVDTSSFADALKSALRQDPDVILVGEMRDLETIETAIVAAETGHLVLSTLHTMDAAETINRIVASFTRRRSSPPKRGTSSCRRCTPWTPAKRSTGSWRRFPRSSRSRSACSWPPSSRRSFRSGCFPARTARGAFPPRRSC